MPGARFEWRWRRTLTEYERVSREIRERPTRWLVTGVAGFVGSNLLEVLLDLDQTVVGLDNFATGKPSNLDQVREIVRPERWRRFRLIEGDLRDLETCRQACEGVHRVLHQAALGSVPRSLEDPIGTNEVNLSGFLNMLVAARDAGVKRLVYASSSSVYGDHPELPKREDRLGTPLSPYAITKRGNELYAETFARHYGMELIGLRYFNVFGPRQDPEGPYAAVIPRWIRRILREEPVVIYGDGSTSRDFCFVENVVRANLLAGMVQRPDAVGRVYNVGCDRQTTLDELFGMLASMLRERVANPDSVRAIHEDFRDGDIRHSRADIRLSRELLGYEPGFHVAGGLEIALPWYLSNL